MRSLFVEMFGVCAFALFILVGLFGLTGSLSGMPEGSSVYLIPLGCFGVLIPGALIVFGIIDAIKYHSMGK